MKELIPKYRDAVFSQEGGILASTGDKIFIRLLLDNRHEVSDQNFHVWVKAKLKSVNYNVVILDEVVLVGKFESERKQKICDENFDALKRRTLVNCPEWSNFWTVQYKISRTDFKSTRSGNRKS